jgi:hypothetical protein
MNPASCDFRRGASAHKVDRLTKALFLNVLHYTPALAAKILCDLIDHVCLIQISGMGLAVGLRNQTI